MLFSGPWFLVHGETGGVHVGGVGIGEANLALYTQLITRCEEGRDQGYITPLAVVGDTVI